MSVQETLAQLVEINSVSARSNADLCNYLAAHCAALGFEIRRASYTDEQGVQKTNLVAFAGTIAETPTVELVLVGHTDTVPFDPNWMEALSLTEDDGKLFGRGACDTKGFIAATLSAASTIDLSTLTRPLALVFTADEEIGLIGAKRLREANALRARYAIVGEPTSLRPMHTGKGYCLAEITVKGREAHSAYPALGSSAVLGAARLIGRIEEIAKQLQNEHHDAFDPPFTTLNVGLIRGGSAKNVVAGECNFTLEWRPIPGQGAEKLLDLLSVAIAEEKQVDAGVTFAVDATRTEDGFDTSRSSRLVKLLEELSGQEAGTVAFGTEAAEMTTLGAEAVVFGPGDIRVAHRTNEFVPTDQLERCVQILRGAIVSICGV